ncbi:CDP-alcohol phosphatidyltransferase family protein [Deinococcus rubellus]|uniref:CDP-alcohol phosphatidyltransferase family protein n=1 Tax=Deinococcus rubellus TaxID=1889240 RepID=A0ABY5YK55_9DEIO|nr:CDP-alcohol phosphatidyltransferase family protein [Deinococcus rubellus]UWX64467.1 CDP-alcohol phosphatidyltransferase family protein [Deinococcus rubellus]
MNSTPATRPGTAESGTIGLAQTRKARPADEWAAERVFRPLAQLLVAPAARLKFKPTQIVLFHTGLVLLSAWQVRRGNVLAPAALLQLKTVLDNLDGQLARATDQTTLTGRYLDSELDVLGNLVLLSAVHGPLLGASANVLLSLILSTDYLWERDYRAARGETFRAPAAQGGDNPRLLSALEAVYNGYFVPQEHGLNRVFEARLRRAAGGDPGPLDRQRYTPLPALTLSANLGLSSQLALFGGLLLLKRPHWYGPSLLLQAAALMGAQLWREEQVRAGRVADLGISSPSTSGFTPPGTPSAR